MAQYTVELNWLIKNNFPIFDETWTTFDPEHKKELCDKIIRRYWFYEIGQETPDRFKWYLNEHLARQMPYWNKLYESELAKLEPLYNRFVETVGNTTTETGRGLSRADRNDINSLKQMADSLRRLEAGNADIIGHLGVVGREDWREQKDGDQDVTYNEDTSQDKTANEDYTGQETGTKKEYLVGKDVFAGEENMTDELTGTKSTTSTGHTDTSATKRYSDTPQGTVSSSGVVIDSKYLTNYTAESGDSDSTASAKEDINNTETRNTNTDNTTDRTQTVDTSHTTDFIHNQDNTEKIVGTKESEQHTEYTEDKNGDKNTTNTQDETQNTTTEHDTKEFSDGSEKTNTSSLGYTEESEAINGKKDNKIVIKGFTIPQAELIMKYRESLINVDSIIVEAMGEHFMGVF